MNTYRVTFAGHREIDHFFALESKLDEILSILLQAKDFVEFYVGNDGEFDTMATSAIRRLKKKYGSHICAMNLILPYKKANLDFISQQFDAVIIPEELYAIHPKKAITARNQWMVDHSDLLICYIKKQSGGAFNTLKYATANAHIEVLNIAQKALGF